MSSNIDSQTLLLALHLGGQVHTLTHRFAAVLVELGFISSAQAYKQYRITRQLLTHYRKELRKLLGEAPNFGGKVDQIS